MRKRQRGFTLVELMIAVAIIGILAAIAIPSYRDYIARAKRADATLALSGLAQAMERYNANNGTYCGSDNGGTVGTCVADDSPGIFAPSVPTDGGTAYYNLRIFTVSATNYELRAVRTGSMASDKCGTLQLAASGVQSLVGSTGGATVAECWRK